MISEQITIDTGPYLVDVAKQNDLEVIQEVLMEREVARAAKEKTPPDFAAALTLDNARFVLAIGLRNKPLAWTITPEELPALWAELIEAAA